MQTRNPERPRTLWRCLLLGIACVALSACSKIEWTDRQHATEAFNDCMIYADNFNAKEVSVSEIISKCTVYAQVIMKEKPNAF